MALPPMYRGNTRLLRGTVFDELNVAANITGAELTFSLRASTIDTVYVLQKSSTEVGEVTITDADEGDYEVQLLPEDTEGLDPGTYFYDVKLVMPDDKTYTVAFGEFPILANITRTVAP